MSGRDGGVSGGDGGGWQWEGGYDDLYAYVKLAILIHRLLWLAIARAFMDSLIHLMDYFLNVYLRKQCYTYTESRPVRRRVSLK